MTNIKPATKAEVVRVTAEMKEVIQRVATKVEASMKSCESSARIYAAAARKK